MSRKTRLRILLILLSSTLLLVSTSQAATDEKSDELRISRSITQPGLAPLTEEALNTALKNSTPSVELALSTTQRTETANKQTRSLYSYAYWIKDLYTRLEYDDDHDGFYQRFTLEFQPDLDVGDADIYADIYISYENSQWDFLTTTDSYPIYSGANNHYFRITTQLDSGYPRGYYDILIELHDTHSGRLLASYGPNDSDSLYALPLEDDYRDSYHSNIHSEFYVSGGGSLGLLGLALLGLMGSIRKRH